MGRRLTRGGGWSAALGLVALTGAVVRMGTLIEPTPDGIGWQWVLLGGFVLGVVVAMVARLARLNVFVASAVAIAVELVVLGRAIDPDSMLGALVPTRATLTAVGDGLRVGLEYLQYSNAPMFPHQEFVLLLLPVFTVIGFAWAWLAAGGNGPVAAVVPAGLYLGVAIADQDASSLWWLLASVAWVGAVLIVSGLEETNRLPRLLGKPGNRGAVSAGAIVMVIALVVTFFATDTIPHGGAVPWRSGGGFGLGGGFSLNPYTSIVQSNLVANSEEVIFEALVSSPDIPADRLSWRLATLDAYDGSEWSTTVRGVEALSSADTLASPDNAFRLSTAPVAASVVIRTLRQQLLPLPAGSTAIESPDRAISDGGHVDPTGELWLDRNTYPGLRYQVTADVPNPSLGELANASGTLSPLFASAQEVGDLTVLGAGSGDLTRPDDLDRYTALPGNIDPRIGNLARTVTIGASSDLERLAFLEEYFRDDGRFIYTTDIDPGHAASDLAAWLAEPDSANYRRGYCEQFATAMGVMARQLGIPTRVVLGFTPGEFNEAGNIIVRGSNAHSWVEAWVDGAGWVKFDPTPRSAGDNPATTDELPSDPSAYVPSNPLSDLSDAGIIIFNPDTGETIDPREDFFEDEAETPFDLEETEGIDETVDEPLTVPSWVWAMVALVLVACAIPTAKWVRRRRRLAKARSGDVSAAWAEITDRLRDLDRQIDQGMTPKEIAEVNLPELAPLAAAHSKAEWGSAKPTEREARRAMKSFDAAEDTLARTIPGVRKVLAAWRPRSLRRP